MTNHVRPCHTSISVYGYLEKEKAKVRREPGVRRQKWGIGRSCSVSSAASVLRSLVRKVLLLGLIGA